MGRQILCPHCKSTFNEDILAKKENPNICPVCDGSLIDDEVPTQNKKEELSFGEGIELGENDSFNEEDIDFWWYSLSEPGTLGEGSSGLTYATCAKCGTHTSFLYPIKFTGNFVLLNARERGKCNKCNNELKNHILSKCPEDYVDPRQRETFITYDKVPRCPICHSSQIHKISATNKVASALTFGVFAAGHVSKTFKCDTCGAKF